MLFLIFLAFLGCESASKINEKEVTSSNLLYKFEGEEARASLRYPSSDIFREGDFEIVSSEIRELEDDYVITIELENNFKNTLAMPGGWDVQTFDIYFFTDRELFKQSLKERKVVFNDGWEKMVLASPLSQSNMIKEVKTSHSEVYDDISEVENLSSGIYIADTIKVFENKIIIKLPKEEFDSIISRLKGIQIFSLNTDPYPVGSVSIREVEEYSSSLNFGGGSYSKVNPNVIGALGNSDQLNSFEDDISRNVYARMDYVHPINKE